MYLKTIFVLTSEQMLLPSNPALEMYFLLL